MPVHATSPHTLPRGRGMRMNQKGALIDGNVVKEIKSGNVKILICDDHFERTTEGVEKILSEYHAAGWIIANRIIEQGGEV